MKLTAKQSISIIKEAIAEMGLDPNDVIEISDERDCLDLLEGFE
jgi:hypothetical protein